MIDIHAIRAANPLPSIAGAQVNLHRTGNEWKGCCPFHADRSPSFTIYSGGERFKCFGCGAQGDVLDYVARLYGLGMVEAARVLGAGDLPKVDLPSLPPAEREAGQNGARARAIWQESKPIFGTIAERYLRARGITCPLPATLRFAPSCWHASTKNFPALMALVEGIDGFAVHRTYISPDGSGKAPIEPAKAMLGATAGGAVRLTDGPEPLVVAEGIETALSLASGLLRGPARVWAALSTSGIRGLHLPPKPGRLTIASDGDAPGREAANALATRAHALGWQVSLLPAPDCRDWNDVLTGKAVAV